MYLIFFLNDYVYSDNAISGEIPEEFAELTNLHSIVLRGNLLGGNLLMFRELSELEYMDFSSNYFDGRLPLFGSNQSNLRVAKLNNNQFVGGIPDDIMDLVQLEDLMAHGNQLAGSLLTQLGMLHNLSRFSVSLSITLDFTSNLCCCRLLIIR